MTQPPQFGDQNPYEQSQFGQQAPPSYLQQPPSKGRRKWPWVLGVAVAFFAIIGLATGGAEEDSETASPAQSSAPSTATVSTTFTAVPEQATTEEVATTTQTPEPQLPPPPPPAPVDRFSSGERNAANKADEYLDYTSFSRSGLIKQLEFEGFDEADAAVGVDSLDVDWMEQAEKKAKEYLDYTSFSQQGLVEQLVFDGFTQSQAEHGATTQY